MKKILIASIFVLLLLMFGCAKPVPEAQAEEPAAQTTVEVTEPEPEPEPETGAIETEGNEVLSAISCNKDEMTLTFTITNVEDVDWYVEKVSVMDIPSKNPVKITVNGRLLKDATEICRLDVILPGASITCTKEYESEAFSRFIRVGEDDLGKLDYNTLKLQTLNTDAVVTFDC